MSDTCEHCGAPALRWHEDGCPERWTGTSYADSTEAAIHYALVRLSVEEQGRVPHREGEKVVYPDLSDLYIKYRRLIRDLAVGRMDPDDYLRNLA